MTSPFDLIAAYRADITKYQRAVERGYTALEKAEDSKDKAAIRKASDTIRVRRLEIRAAQEKIDNVIREHGLCGCGNRRKAQGRPMCETCLSA